MRIAAKKIVNFRKTIWDHYKRNKRDLPWRRTTDPYRIVVSEVMLQQTQVARVVQKYSEFIKAFPTFKSLASASNIQVLRLWQGMGYNRRALYLKALSRIVVERYKGRLPDDPKVLIQLPAIGSATTGSILAFVFNKPTAFIETNIRRTYLHVFFKNKKDISDKQLLPLIEQTIQSNNPREWYWALMDYGAMLAKKIPNPNRKSIHYARQSPFNGSIRQIRGAVLRFILTKEKVTKKELSDALFYGKDKIAIVLQELVEEGFLRKTSHIYKVQ